jgi:hypothetical protein
VFDYRAQLIRVIDGDTVVINFDQGLHSRQEESIRLIIVGAPEPDEAGYEEAKQFTIQWMENLDESRRWPLYIFTEPNRNFEPDERRSFVRFLGTVTDIRGSRPTLNQALKNFLLQHPEWGSGM